MFHTSPTKIESGSINQFGIAGTCLFFSNDIYVMTASKEVFVYEADFNCIPASQLHDTAIISQIASYFDVDLDVAEGLLDASVNEWEQGADAEGSWWLQGKRGECAVKMGFDGCEDRDEQGIVYIIPMLGRESELKEVAR
jgi:hypothetical protein